MGGSRLLPVIKRSRAKPEGPDPDHLWIVSEPTIDGNSFIVVFNFADLAWSRTPSECLVYCEAMMTIANRADHDAAVIKQLVATGLPAGEAARLVMDLRADRPPVVVDGPLHFEPGVSSDGEFRPFIALSVDSVKVGQWDVDQASAHAVAVLSVAATADLDQAYLRALMGAVGLDEGTARAVVDGLHAHRILA